MKFDRRRLITTSEIRIVAFLIMLGLFILSVLIGVNIGLSRSIPGGGGFFVGWEASRAFLFDHIEVYGSVIAIQTQRLVYGGVSAHGQDPYILTIPFYLLPSYFPFSFLADPGLARGLWMSLAEVALVLMAFLSLQLIEWEPRRFFLALLLLLAVFSFYSNWALFEGSPAVFLGLLYVGILFSFYAGMDELTGVLLALSLFHWETGLIFLILVFWRVFSERRRRIMAGLVMALCVLLPLSFLIYGGNWLLPFLAANLASFRSGFGISTAVVFSHLWPTGALLIARVVSGIGLVLLVYEWYTARYSDFRRFIWLVCFALAVTPLLGLRTSISDLVVLFPAWVLIFAATIERWRAGYWLGGLYWLIVLILPWGLYIHSILLNEGLSQDLLFLTYPLFTMLGLYWTRWWFLRPPRTWLDHVRSTLS